MSCTESRFSFALITLKAVSACPAKNFFMLPAFAVCSSLLILFCTSTSLPANTGKVASPPRTTSLRGRIVPAAISAPSFTVLPCAAGASVIIVVPRASQPSPSALRFHTTPMSASGVLPCVSRWLAKSSSTPSSSTSHGCRECRPLYSTRPSSAFTPASSTTLSLLPLSKESCNLPSFSSACVTMPELSGTPKTSCTSFKSAKEIMRYSLGARQSPCPALTSSCACSSP